MQRAQRALYRKYLPTFDLSRPPESSAAGSSAPDSTTSSTPAPHDLAHQLDTPHSPITSVKLKPSDSVTSQVLAELEEAAAEAETAGHDAQHDRQEVPTRVYQVLRKAHSAGEVLTTDNCGASRVPHPVVLKILPTAGGSEPAPSSSQCSSNADIACCSGDSSSGRSSNTDQAPSPSSRLYIDSQSQHSSHEEDDDSLISTRMQRMQSSNYGHPAMQQSMTDSDTCIESPEQTASVQQQGCAQVENCQQDDVGHKQQHTAMGPSETCQEHSCSAAAAAAAAEHADVMNNADALCCTSTHSFTASSSQQQEVIQVNTTDSIAGLQDAQLSECSSGASASNSDQHSISSEPYSVVSETVTYASTGDLQSKLQGVTGLMTRTTVHTVSNSMKSTSGHAGRGTPFATAYNFTGLHAP